MTGLIWKRFQINPVIGNVQMLESSRNSDLQLLTFAFLPELEFLVDEEKYFRRSAGRIGRLLVLRGGYRGTRKQTENGNREQPTDAHAFAPWINKKSGDF